MSSRLATDPRIVSALASIERCDATGFMVEVEAIFYADPEDDPVADEVGDLLIGALVRGFRGRRPTVDQLRSASEWVREDAAEWVDGLPATEEFDSLLRVATGYEETTRLTRGELVVGGLFSVMHCLRHGKPGTAWTVALGEVREMLHTYGGAGGWIEDWSDPRSPRYFLAWAGDWSDSGDPAQELVATQECAMVTAPTVIPPGLLGDDAVKIIAFAEEMAVLTGQRLMFFSELTRMLTSAGDSWAAHGVDWRLFTVPGERSR